jgi:hypothetical protein
MSESGFSEKKEYNEFEKQTTNKTKSMFKNKPFVV